MRIIDQRHIISFFAEAHPTLWVRCLKAEAANPRLITGQVARNEGDVLVLRLEESGADRYTALRLTDSFYEFAVSLTPFPTVR